MATMITLSTFRRASASRSIRSSGTFKAVAALHELIASRPFSLEASSSCSVTSATALLAPNRGKDPHNGAPSLLPFSCLGGATSLARSIATGTGTGLQSDEQRMKAARDILQTTAVLDLRDHMTNMSRQRAIVPRQELLDLCISSGAAATESHARELLEALHMSGVVLGSGKWVYLRPEDVVHSIIKSIPHTEEELQNRIQEVDSHLKPLQKSREEIEKKGHTRGKLFLFAVLAGMLAQYGVIFRLVYWDLSWDVMEPVAYFCTGGTSTLCLLYYLFFQTECTYTDLQNQWKRKYIESVSFPHSHYENLLREKSSYSSLLEGIRAAGKQAP